MPELRILSPNNIDEARGLMGEIEAHVEGVEIMAPKSQLRLVKITGLDSRAANILKQEMLSKGGDAALSWRVFQLEAEEATAIAIGTLKQFRDVIPKLAKQPFELKEVSSKLKEALYAYDSPPSPLPVAGRTLDFTARTYIMGVLNVTPDSFSDGGEHFSTGAAITHAKRMVAEGADIIDIGGESTRPGAEPVSAEDELARVVPVIEDLAGSTDAILSIDTSKPEVAKAALRAGAHIVNDVTGLSNLRMVEVVAASGAPAIIMHMKGTPGTMQENPVYEDLMGEIIAYLRARLESARKGGVAPEKLLVDPGIGFGKTFEHNLEIIKHLSEVKILGKAIVLGTSRKAFIGKILGIERACERVFGTAATVALGIANGANILRVHDVKEMAQVARMADAIQCGRY
ncbi:MAG: dihydropteroate synthase [Actinobacteria bacterium]|nr:dihydropteroate synthase [Actinomycetota bacterium]